LSKSFTRASRKYPSRDASYLVITPRS
jgi:hypothetical protein